MADLSDGLSGDIEERARDYYNHSTRRAMIGREWDDLSRIEKAGWLAHAAKRIDQVRANG